MIKQRMQLLNYLLPLTILSLVKADNLPKDCFQLITVTKTFEGLSPTTLPDGVKTYITTDLKEHFISVTICDEFYEENGLVVTKTVEVPSATLTSTVTSCNALNGIAKRDCLEGKTTLATETKL